MKKKTIRKSIYGVQKDGLYVDVRKKAGKGGSGKGYDRTIREMKKLARDIGKDTFERLGLKYTEDEKRR